MHPQCELTFREWVRGDRGFLVRLEELGIWAQGLREWEDRCQLSIEILELSGNATQLSRLDVYAIYEHYACRDKHDQADFVFM